MAYLPKDVVEDFIAARKAKGQFATVSFIKQDGSLRVINGCFAPLSHIIGSDRGVIQGEAMKARGQVAIYDVQKSKWASFYLDKVVELA